jgi:IPT/TIG domain-containing protein
MPPPLIVGLTPPSGPVGTLVTISGSRFGSSGTVTFNAGVDATSFLYYNSNQIGVYVPTGATTGNVVVSNAGGSSTGSHVFTVTTLPPPTITSLTPNTGPVGTSVVIAGTNFGTAQNTSTVKFNGVAAPVTSWSPTSLTVTVPSTAMTGPVIVTVGGVASNSNTFTVTTPSNGGFGGSLNLFLIPAEDANGAAVIWTLDPTNFNDAFSNSFYRWKVEDVIAGRIPTISRVIISYRDLGLATINVTLNGTNDQGQAVSNTVPVIIGNIVPLGIILTTLVGISLSAQNLQLSISRDANAGPVSITKVRMEGRVETTVY